MSWGDHTSLIELRIAIMLRKPISVAVVLKRRYVDELLLLTVTVVVRSPT